VSHPKLASITSIFLAAKSPGRFASGLAMVMVDFPTFTALNDPNMAGLIYAKKQEINGCWAASTKISSLGHLIILAETSFTTFFLWKAMIYTVYTPEV